MHAYKRIDMRPCFSLFNPSKQVTQPNNNKKTYIYPKEVANKIPLVHAKNQGRNNNPITGQPVI